MAPDAPPSADYAPAPPKREGLAALNRKQRRQIGAIQRKHRRAQAKREREQSTTRPRRPEVAHHDTGGSSPSAPALCAATGASSSQADPMGACGCPDDCEAHAPLTPAERFDLVTLGVVERAS